MKKFAFLLGLVVFAPAAQAETLHCYLGVGSNSAPSCSAKPGTLDFGNAAVVRAYDTPDYRLFLRPSSLVRGAYDSSLVSTKAEGTQTYIFQTMIATRRGLQILTDPRAPLPSIKYEQGPGTNEYLRAGAPDFSHPGMLKRVNATLAFIDSLGGARELYVGIGMITAIICAKADQATEAAWREFVANFDRECVR